MDYSPINYYKDTITSLTPQTPNKFNFPTHNNDLFYSLSKSMKNNKGNFYTRVKPNFLEQLFKTQNSNAQSLAQYINDDK